MLAWCEDISVDCGSGPAVFAHSPKMLVLLKLLKHTLRRSEKVRLFPHTAAVQIRSPFLRSPELRQQRLPQPLQTTRHRYLSRVADPPSVAIPIAARRATQANCFQVLIFSQSTKMISLVERTLTESPHPDPALRTAAAPGRDDQQQAAA